MKSGRSYSSPTRTAQSARTRAVVLGAASKLFIAEGGYASTSMGTIATASGVSVQTLYNLFGGKAALLKAVYDSTLAGDDEPVPMSERPMFVAMAEEPDARLLLIRYARIGAVLMRRMGPLVARIREGAMTGDPDLTALVATSAQERLVGATQLVDRVSALTPLRPGLTRPRARDIVWTHTSFEMWDLLVTQRGWSGRFYATYLGSSMGRALLPDD